MAFSTQRDFINIPPCMGSKSNPARNDADSECNAACAAGLYTSLLPDLVGLWGRLNGNDGRDLRPKGGAQDPNVTTAAASSESDSGIQSEPYGRPTDLRNQPNRKDRESPRPNSLSPDNVESLLRALQDEGKFTVETIYDLIKKYQDYIKQLLTDNKVPSGGLKKLIEYIESHISSISELIGKLKIPENARDTLLDDMKSLLSIMKTFMCESQRENELINQELQRVNFDRHSLQLSLQKLTHVEDKIMDLKAQAGKACCLQNELDDLKSQLEKSRSNSNALLQCLMTAKKDRNEYEEKHRTDLEKTCSDMKKWKCKAELLNDMRQKDMLELEKWKIHCSRLSVELDRATERILRGHETKRKLFFAESMRMELEKQIEEMMGIIKNLNDQKNGNLLAPDGTVLGADPSELVTVSNHQNCQTAISNLLIQSKNTLESILANVNEEYPADQSSANETAFLKKLREENAKLKTENHNLKSTKSDGNVKALEDLVDKLKNELDECYKKRRKGPVSDDLDNLRKQLDECQAENERLRKLTDPVRECELQKMQRDMKEGVDCLKKQLENCQAENARLRKLNPASAKDCECEIRKMQKDIQELREKFEKSQKENKSLKEVLNARGENQPEPDISKPEIVIGMQRFSQDGSSANYSQETQRSSPEHGDGGTEGMIVGPQTESSAESSDSDQTTAEKCTCGHHSPGERCPQCEFECESSELSYASETDTGETQAPGQTTLSYVQALLLKKDEKIKKLEKQCSFLQENISKLDKEKERHEVRAKTVVLLGKEISKFKNDLQEQGSMLQQAKERINAHRVDLQEGQKLLYCLQEKTVVLTQENARLQEEKSARDAIKTEKDRKNGSLRDLDKDEEELEIELDLSRRDAERYRKEFNDRVRMMLEEKAKLQKENARLVKELAGLDEVVDEINVERSKNRRLEQLIGELEEKIDAMHGHPSETKFDQSSTNYRELVEKLRNQLDEEVNVNNKLREEMSSQTGELEEMKKIIDAKNREIESLKLKTPSQIASSTTTTGQIPSSTTGQQSSKQEVPVSLPQEYQTLISALRTELNSEKSRYHKLRSKFVTYSLKITELEKKLRDKKAIIDKEIQTQPYWDDVAVQVSFRQDDTATTSTLQSQLKSHTETNRRLQTKLILEYLKNEKLVKDNSKLKDQLEQLYEECASKAIKVNQRIQTDYLESPWSVDQETSWQRSPSDSAPNNRGLLEVAHEFQDLSDQLKEQLRIEKDKSRKLQTQVVVDSNKMEELKTKLKKSRAQVAQLQSILKRRESSIAELQKSIDDLTGGTSLENKETQTVAAPGRGGVGGATVFSSHGIASLQKQLEIQIKRNYELTKDYSNEITNTKALKDEVKQAQKEIRKLYKCIQEVEKEKETLKQRNEELSQEMKRSKEASANTNNVKSTGLKSPVGDEQTSGAQPHSSARARSAKRESEDKATPQTGGTIPKMNKTTKTFSSRLHGICCKIQEAGLESLNAKDLTYLHREVYTAGRKLKISDSESPNEKCWDFIANLPPIPMNKEGKIMARGKYQLFDDNPPSSSVYSSLIDTVGEVNYLETELDNANQVLQHLKREYEKESRNEGRERHRGGGNKFSPKPFDNQMFGGIRRENNRSY